MLDKAESKKLVVVPATYETETEQVLVKPASKRYETVPAQYRTDDEQVVDIPAHTMWRRGTTTVPGAISTKSDQNTGEIMCLVNVPATYKTIHKTVLVQPASVQEVDVPAQYRTVTKTVVKNPATTQEVDIPATYKTVRVQQLVKPADTVRTPIPAEYETVTSRKKVSDEQLKWREIVCETNMTPGLARRLQTRLRETGDYKGPIDGVFGRETMTAAQRYSGEHDLPVGRNYITLDMLKLLDMSE